MNTYQAYDYYPRRYTSQQVDTLGVFYRFAEACIFIATFRESVDVKIWK